ncbi:MAG: tRNA (adenosine(37)-N6)-dimethylallyltransferase MiaA [Propionibacteriaceae bacterium]|jgi:tRNA dimethylallyltransferase|nr:tRNA (adenosine(37)-N6)-dimethylallyltransferase MiaA [Propionibacteriaceae bacterium]
MNGVLVLLGPTAAGKSDLAVALADWWAQRGQAVEIVSADSMSVYRGMDIGTAKPSLACRRRVPHHLIDLMEVTESASVAQFQALARAAIADCQARRALPIVVGGSALYLRAVIDRFDFPGSDPERRAALEAELAQIGPEALHRRLVQLDPTAAAGIQPGNGRRLVRALEAIAVSGAFRSSLPQLDYALDGVVQIGLDLPRPELDRRIAQRVDQMWRDGLLEEVAGLLQRGLASGRTAARAIGYRQAIDQLAGRSSADQARQETVQRTRRFARRQLSWWRRDPRIEWLQGDPAPQPAAVAELVAGRLGLPGPGV